MANDVQLHPMLIGHLQIFRQMTVQILCLISNWLVFLSLSCNSSLYSLDTSLLSDYDELSFHILDSVF